MFNPIIKKIFFITTILFTILTACNKDEKKILAQIINDLNFKNTTDIKVFIALDTECPLSQSYTKKINELSEKYKKEVMFICFFPGKYHTDKGVANFKKKYDLKIKSFIDRDLTATNIFGANVVPEVFVLNENYKIVYKGLIDNWIGELGRKKQYINREYLIDAIDASLNNDLPLISSTEAIGCIIEK